MVRKHFIQPYDELDFDQIFIAREQELDRFAFYLDRWQQFLFDLDPDDTPLVKSAPSPDNKLQGLLVLLFGRGGFGKSTLLRQFRKCAQQKENLVLSDIIDWEYHVEGKRDLFNPAVGQKIDENEYYRLLMTQLALALRKEIKDFKTFLIAQNEVERARKDANQALENMQKDDRYKWLRGFTVDVVTDLVRSYIPGSATMLKYPQVKTGLDEVAKVTQDQLVQIHHRLQDKLGSRLENYLDPSLRLGLALGTDLQRFARNYPLLIFFDTYEEIDEGDSLLRIVMAAAGERVGWVIAGRDNLWAGLEQRQRSISLEIGYKEIASLNRTLAINFNTGDIGAFTVSEIKDYFDRLCQLVRAKPSLPKIERHEAEQILNVTKGVPLAVKIAAGLFKEITNLNSIIEDVEGHPLIIDVMVRRYLMHARDSLEERSRLYSLALLRRSDQPHAIAVALNLSPNEARIEYRNELVRLHRRYSFIFTQKDYPTLHQEVRYFLRLWLLEHRRDPEIIILNERLKEVHVKRLEYLEDSRHKMSNLEDRLLDDDWVGVYLDLTEQQFWIDPVEGMRLLQPLIIAASVLNRSIIAIAVVIGQFFEKTMSQLHRDWWKKASLSLFDTGISYISFEIIASDLRTRVNVAPILNQFLASEVNDVQSLEKPTIRLYRNQLNKKNLDAIFALKDLIQLFEQRSLAFELPVPSYQEELEAALWWRLGDLYYIQDKKEALRWYEKSLKRLKYLPIVFNLKKSIEQVILEIAYNFLQKRKYNEAIIYLNRCVDISSENPAIYNSRGNAYFNLKRYQKALEDYNRAVELDPTDAMAYYSRASAYLQLKECQKALEDCNRAIELDPTDAATHYNRASVYHDLKEYQKALEDCNRAIELDPTDAVAYHNRANIYHDLKEYQKALENFDRAIKLDPTDAAVYHNRASVYLDLKEHQKALEDYNRAIELDPTDAETHYNRAGAYLQLKEYQKALEDCNRAIKLDPTDAATHYNRASVYLDLKEYQKALEDYNRAIELDPTDEMGYFNRGLTNLFLKDIEQARSDYSKSYEVCPDDIDCWWMDIWVRMEKQRPDRELLLELEGIANVDPQYFLAFICQAIMLALRGKVKEGLMEIEKAIVLNSDQWDAYYWKGVLCAYYWGLARLDEAKANIEKAIMLGLPPVLLTTLYWLEQDRPEVFEQLAKPLLELYEI